MAKERADYHDNLEMLRELYPGKVSITIKEACALMDRDRRTLLKDRGFPAQLLGGQYIVPLVGLAKYLS